MISLNVIIGWIVFYICLFILIFLVSFWVLYKKRHSGPQYPLMQRCGKHIFYQYKSVCGHIKLDSYYDNVDLEKFANIIKTAFESGITTEKFGNFVFDKYGDQKIRTK